MFSNTLIRNWEFRSNQSSRTNWKGGNSTGLIMSLSKRTCPPSRLIVLVFNPTLYIKRWHQKVQTSEGSRWGERIMTKSFPTLHMRITYGTEASKITRDWFTRSKCSNKMLKLWSTVLSSFGFAFFWQHRMPLSSQSWTRRIRRLSQQTNNNFQEWPTNEVSLWLLAHY